MAFKPSKRAITVGIVSLILAGAVVGYVAIEADKRREERARNPIPKDPSRLEFDDPAVEIALQIGDKNLNRLLLDPDPVRIRERIELVRADVNRLLGRDIAPTEQIVELAVADHRLRQEEARKITMAYQAGEISKEEVAARAQALMDGQAAEFKAIIGLTDAEFVMLEADWRRRQGQAPQTPPQ